MDIELTMLKRMIRTAKDMRYLDTKKYKIWSEKLIEIGKMLGGWVKSVKMKNKDAAL